MSKAHSPNGCPECNGHLDFDAGETVCSDCGLVVSEYRIDHGPEWRSFSDDDRNPARTGAPLTHSRHDRGLSTKIGRSTRIKGRKRRKFARLRRQHNRARISSKRERNQVYAFTEIRRVTSALSLPNTIRDQACTLFKSAQKENLLRGRSLEGFAAACIYAACRVMGVARSVEEVCEVAKSTEAEQQAAYRALNRDLGLPIAPTPPTEYIPRFATKLDLDCDVERLAREYATEAQEDGSLGGKNPCGVAAACLYTAARDLNADCTQSEAADVADVTPVTLRKTYVALRD
ncbi:transcription initiation factor IIB [Haloferax sp. DFSO60]|uniref:transcription initiation factor IIB n=1 Tax=Haloferax sp. DFSO60 TaxID=3388652 RepID=UPI00397B20B5